MHLLIDHTYTVIVALIVAYWTVMVLYRLMKRAPIPSGEVILYVIGWVVLAVLLRHVLQQERMKSERTNASTIPLTAARTRLQAAGQT